MEKMRACAFFVRALPRAERLCLKRYAHALLPGAAYALDGASLSVKPGCNVSLTGGGDGVTITRGRTSGRLFEVRGARLELRNLRLEGGQAQVRHRFLAARRRALRTRHPPTTGKRHVMTRCKRAAGGRRHPCERPQRCLGHQKLLHCPLPRRSLCERGERSCPASSTSVCGSALEMDTV